MQKESNRSGEIFIEIQGSDGFSITVGVVKDPI